MILNWFWKVLIATSALWNVSGGYQMITNQTRFLGDLSTAGAPSLFVSLCGIFLLLLAALTILILVDVGRYWPLAWFAAGGRSIAGATMLYYWSNGWVPDGIIVPGVIDLIFALCFLAFAMNCWRGANGLGVSRLQS